ncbi:MAG: Pycsar system effector family protein [Actinomycetota bacterium]
MRERQASSGALEVARELLRDGRDELRRADEKACSLLAAIGVVAGVLLTGAFGGSWSPAIFHQSERVAWWLGVTATGAAICYLVSTLIPRLPSAKDTGRVTSFVEVARLERSAKTRAGAVERDHLGIAIRFAAEDVFGHTLDRVRVVSWIASVKYRRIRVAIYLMTAGAALIGAAVTLHLAGR